MARSDSRGGRDAAGVGPYKRPDVRLVPLRKMKDWSIADGEPDIRGWEVRTVSGAKIGNVQDLLVDEKSGEAVMLDIDLDGTDRHSLAPIRAAQIDRQLRVVRIDSADIEGSVPSLSRTATTDDEARRFNEGYGRAYGQRGWRSDRDYVVDRDEDEVRFAHRDPDHDRDRAALGGAAAAAAASSASPSARESLRDERAERLAEREARREVASEPARTDADRPAGDRPAGQRTVRYLTDEGVEETVVETRPVVVEEVVVRRRVIKPDADKSADERR